MAYQKELITAVNAAKTAGGRMEAHFHNYHVSSLIVQNAGGVVLGPDGRKFEPMKRGIIAANSNATMERLEKLGILKLCSRLDRISPR